MQLKKVHLDQDGIRMFVGVIDAAILDVLWSEQRPMTMRGVHNKLAHRWHFNTVATIMYRMVKAGTLIRIGDRQPVFKPFDLNEDNFIDRCMMIVTERMRSEYPDTFNEIVAAYFQMVVK